jgi:ElaB/YqjD/DUF883 family membrane-anchored ribosome-binding protein
MKTETDKITQTADDVLNQLRSLVSEAEKILSQAPEEARNCEATLAALRERLEAAQERATELYRRGRQKVVAGAKYADDAIRDNPYQSIAVALGIGLVAGVLIGRRANAPSR